MDNLSKYIFFFFFFIDSLMLFDIKLNITSKNNKKIIKALINNIILGSPLNF